jgi:hypothetical protein
MRKLPILTLCIAVVAANNLSAAELRIGTATTSITPDKPVALDGHRGLRISKKVESPCTATALALESRDGDSVIMVSCDIVAIRAGIQDKVREKVKLRLPDFDATKLFLCATHTHNAPVTLEGRYAIPDTGVMKPSEYADFMTTRVADIVAESWQKRRPGKVGWAQSQAVVAQNRRATYADGSSKMYGATNDPKFRGMEGYEDHSLDVLFFWDDKDQLIATAINVPSPAQETEGGSLLHADFWHPARQMLQKRHGKELAVLGLTGAGGDQTSRPQFGKAADERMRKLRGLTRMEEVARRIVNGWEDAYECARKDIRGDVVLRHYVKAIELPMRKVTDTEAAEARKEAAKYAKDPAQLWNHRWHQGVVERHEAQQAGTETPFKMELHAVRLGDVVICTNPFELFTDFGVQMKARSPAVQTFVIQLAGDSGGYLPTERAVRGGSYSAVIQSSRVGPDGGQLLVDHTVKAINTLWPPPVK